MGWGICNHLIKSRGNESWTRMLGDITILKCFVPETDLQDLTHPGSGAGSGCWGGGGVYSPITNVQGCYVAVIDLLKLEGY